MEDRPFAKSTLQVFRAQLILHERVREVFGLSEKAEHEGGAGHDQHPGPGRGEGHLQFAGRRDGQTDAGRWRLWSSPGSKTGAQARGYEGYLGSSVKGEAAIDWSNQTGAAGPAAQVVADADRLLELSRQAQGELAEDSAERQRVVAAAELLGQLLLQDIERQSPDGDGDDGVSLKDGVSKDRMVSVHDPEMRHGHKSSNKRFDGHKAAIVVDTDTQLITAVGVLQGNALDNLGFWTW